MVVSEQRTIAVGAVVVVALGLVFAVLSGRGEVASAKAGQYAVEAVFNRIDGLAAGDEVRLGGVRIGAVAGQFLNENYQAVVTLAIDEGVLLPADTSAAIHTDGLFGSKYVVMEPGGDEVNLADGDVITFTQDSLVVSDLLEQIIAMGKTVQSDKAQERKGSD